MRMNPDRRQFLQALAGSLGGVQLLLPGAAIGQARRFDDFKALVVLFLHGGNDAHNMIVPLASDGDSSHAAYARSRADLAVASRDLSCQGDNAYAAASDRAAYLKGVYAFRGAAATGGGDGEDGGLLGGVLGGDNSPPPGAPCEGVPPNAGGEDFGINGLMPELAALFRDGRAAAVANVGSLVEPLGKSELGQARLPPFLFAHNHQQRAMETGWADNLQASGWAGRLADLWQAHAAGGVNGQSPLGMNISFAGASRMMSGAFNRAVEIRPGTTSLFPTAQGFDPALFGQLNAARDGDSAPARVFKARQRSAAELHALLASGYAATDDYSGLSDPYGNPLFSRPTPEQLALERGLGGGTLRACRDVARMIDFARNSLGLERLVFFVGMGGFDTHGDQGAEHPRLLRELSLAIGGFQQAMDSLGLSEAVTLCSLSDFGRTLGNNGTGTDHAWGGHNLAVGGAVNGGHLYGRMPDMRLGGADDISSGERAKGRMIPSTAVDQFLGALLDWFGVSEDEMPLILPNLANFQSGSRLRSAYLSGLMRGAGGA